jgi:hypothetical protein
VTQAIGVSSEQRDIFADLPYKRHKGRIPSGVMFQAAGLTLSGKGVQNNGTPDLGKAVGIACLILENVPFIYWWTWSISILMQNIQCV